MTKLRGKYLEAGWFPTAIATKLGLAPKADTPSLTLTSVHEITQKLWQITSVKISAASSLPWNMVARPRTPATLPTPIICNKGQRYPNCSFRKYILITQGLEEDWIIG